MDKIRTFLTKRPAIPMWVLLAGGLFLFGIGAAASGGSEATKDLSAQQEGSTGTIATGPFPTEVAPETQPPTTEAPTTTQPPKAWRQVATLSGSSSKRGTTFHLDGGDARLTWNAKTQFFAVYLVEAGQDLKTDGGFPETTCTSPCADQTQLQGKSGEYYLDVSGSGSWSVTVEELR